MSWLRPFHWRRKPWKEERFIDGNYLSQVLRRDCETIYEIRDTEHVWTMMAVSFDKNQCQSVTNKGRISFCHDMIIYDCKQFLKSCVEWNRIQIKIFMSPFLQMKLTFKNMNKVVQNFQNCYYL